MGVFLLLFLLLSKGPNDFMKFVTRSAFRSHPGNKVHEITWAVRKQQEQEQEDKEQQKTTTIQTSTTHSIGPNDFMKFVTRMAFRSRPGNKFHEITWAIRKQQEQEQEDKQQPTNNKQQT